MKDVLGVDGDFVGVMDGLRIVDDEGDHVCLAIVLPCLSLFEPYFQLPRFLVDLAMLGVTAKCLLSSCCRGLLVLRSVFPCCRYTCG